MPAPNRHGAVTNTVCPSHGDDIDSDGACVTGPQPYSGGENESFPGMLPVPSDSPLHPLEITAESQTILQVPPGRFGLQCLYLGIGYQLILHMQRAIL
jgi:hypothetical protein